VRDTNDKAAAESHQRPTIEQALERIRIWQEALHYYDKRRLMVLVYVITINASLLSLPNLGFYERVLAALINPVTDKSVVSLC